MLSDFFGTIWSTVVGLVVTIGSLLGAPPGLQPAPVQPPPVQVQAPAAGRVCCEHVPSGRVFYAPVNLCTPAAQRRIVPEARCQQAQELVCCAFPSGWRGLVNRTTCTNIGGGEVPMDQCQKPPQPQPQPPQQQPQPQPPQQPQPKPQPAPAPTPAPPPFSICCRRPDGSYTWTHPALCIPPRQPAPGDACRSEEALVCCRGPAGIPFTTRHSNCRNLRLVVIASGACPAGAVATQPGAVTTITPRRPVAPEF